MRRPLVLLALLTAGCGGGTHHVRATVTATPVAARDLPRLSDAAPCEAIARATCSTLRVPLDHSGSEPGTLDLRVAESGPGGAPVLVFLSGGPGQPGLPFLATARSRLGAIASHYRLVVIDQRGTGDDALRCPALQREMGASDLTPPTAAAVRSCAARIGDKRRFFATTDTVEDLELLRQSLGADKLAIDGVSYGTYVAERYALAHPDRVSRLVLDSVVPHAGVTLMSEVSVRATARVLGSAAARDIATVVRREHDAPALLDVVTALSIGRPQLAPAVRALRRAASGDAGPLRRLVSAVQRSEGGYKAAELSQGLHASTLCADTAAPWGDASAPAAGRAQALETAATGLDAWPFGITALTGNGIARTCLYWPPEAVKAPQVAADLPNVPALLLAGTKDLSTPLEWARAERAHAPSGKLVVVPGAGHSLQSQGGPVVRRALTRFLTPPVRARAAGASARRSAGDRSARRASAR